MGSSIASGVPGFRTLVATIDLPVWANRENNVKTGFSMPLRPSLRLALGGITHPRWLLWNSRTHAASSRYAVDVSRTLSPSAGPPCYLPELSAIRPGATT
ncbi:alpha-hydroxy-acid oxidizing protein [Cupriavidus basilensis]